MFTDAVAPGIMDPPAKVVLEYALPYESLMKYSDSADVRLPVLITVMVTLVGELTW
jgi:hypothetical protein